MMNSLNRIHQQSQRWTTEQPTAATLFDSLQTTLAELNKAVRTQTKTINMVQSLNTKASESFNVGHTIAKKIDHLLTDHLLNARKATFQQGQP